MVNSELTRHAVRTFKGTKLFGTENAMLLAAFLIE